MTELTFPQLGEGIEKAIVSYIYVKPKESVEQGDDIIELTTDKATFNVFATQRGIIKEIKVQLEQEVSLGQILAIIE